MTLRGWVEPDDWIGALDGATADQMGRVWLLLAWADQIAAAPPNERCPIEAGQWMAAAARLKADIDAPPDEEEPAPLMLTAEDSPAEHGGDGRWRCFPVAELHETEDRGHWQAFPVRELDETNDKRFWQRGERGVGGNAPKAPLWKGASFDQYDPHGAGEREVAVTPGLLKKVRKPRPGAGSLLGKKYSVKIRRRAVLSELDRARVAFRDVTNRTNSRTIIACLIPPGTYLTNKAPYLAFVDGTARDQAACLGIMNSLPFDWQARRFVEINVSFFILEGLRVPDLTDADFDAIALAAARLSAVDDRFARFAQANGVECGPLDPAEHVRLRIEIDARVARAWNLTADDLEVIYEDFTENAVTPAYRRALLERLGELG